MQSSDLIRVVFKQLSLTVRSEIPGTDKKVRTSVRKSSSIFQNDTQNGMWGLHLNRKLRGGGIRATLHSASAPQRRRCRRGYRQTVRRKNLPAAAPRGDKEAGTGGDSGRAHTRACTHTHTRAARRCHPASSEPLRRLRPLRLHGPSDRESGRQVPRSPNVKKK